jgi:hypothetical protein
MRYAQLKTLVLQTLKTRKSARFNPVEARNRLGTEVKSLYFIREITVS